MIDQAKHDERHGEGLDLHLIGAVVGIASGLLIFGGHTLGLRQARRPHGCASRSVG